MTKTFAIRTKLMLALIPSLLISCRFSESPPTPSSLDTFASEKAEWNQLGNSDLFGKEHSFRMSPVSQNSRCYLSGDLGLSLQVCGSLASWQVRLDLSQRFGSEDAIKQIRTLDSFQRREDSAVEFCIAIGQKPGMKRNLAYTEPCDEERPSQWLTLSGSRLARFKPDSQELIFAENMQALDLFVSTYRQDNSYSPSINGYIASQLVEGDLVGAPIASESPFQRNRASEKSSIFWGNLPPISKISVVPSPSQHPIGAIVVDYHTGEQEILGACQIEKARCKPGLSASHSYELKKGEYLTNLGVLSTEKKIEGLIFQVKTIDSDTPKTVLEVGKINQSAEVQWLSDPTTDEPSRLRSLGTDKVLAGFKVNYQTYNAYEQLPNIEFYSKKDPANLDVDIYLTHIAGIFVRNPAYKAHNPEAFAPNGSGFRSTVIKDARQTIGLAVAKTPSLPTLDNNLLFPVGTSNERRRQLYDRFFHEQSNHFVTGFANNRLAPRSLARMIVCGKNFLEGIYLIPHHDDVDQMAEGFGDYSCSDSLILDLEPNEYITRMWWKPAQAEKLSWPDEGYSGTDRLSLAGERIGGIRIDTNKKAFRLVFESTNSEAISGVWRLAFEKPGYAITGFFGLANPSLRQPLDKNLKESKFDTARFLGLAGVLRMHPIFLRLSDVSLPHPSIRDPRIAQTPVIGLSNAGASFDSSYWLYPKDQIKKISVWADQRPLPVQGSPRSYKVLSGFEIHYEPDPNSKSDLKVKTISEGFHRGERFELILQPGEWVEKVTFHKRSLEAEEPSKSSSNQLICGLSLETNRGRQLQAGQTDSDNEPLSSTVIEFFENNQFMGFHGFLLGDVMTALGVLYR